ncbi:hypothetical protein [Pusillimonas sp. ANT_WB101]|uniref:hypothetical protein n=1 Tax=Pusillimonas sp. ANT_WB101 TaxID=2597356 RepID=UPI0011ECCFEA|nr:hypothetical protein [Pusillimonas sp. ANT_WB101]KAA0910685.1 hypothetical protein FQ179_02070 [Pusillimonas sp. ANT_WB101]
MEPEKGQYGLWYAGTVGFATKDEAQAYIDRGMKHNDYSQEAERALPKPQKSDSIAGYPKGEWIAAIVVGLAILGGGYWFMYGSESKTHRVGREFVSMDQCLEFIANDTGDQLNVISDELGDVSGKTVLDGLFFRCEARTTGTRGLVLEGRWDRLK